MVVEACLLLIQAGRSFGLPFPSKHTVFRARYVPSAREVFSCLHVGKSPAIRKSSGPFLPIEVFRMLGVIVISSMDVIGFEVQVAQSSMD